MVDFDTPYATLDRRPGRAPRLHFWVTVRFDTPGWTWTLRPRVPQGINPADLLLALTLTAPSEVVPDVVTPALIEYVVLNPSIDYTDIDVTVEGNLGLHADVVHTA